MAPSAMSRGSDNNWTKSLSEAQPVPYWLDDPAGPARSPR
ncbi:Oxidoreductase OS=Streptomyces glaucescens OX=1907 GN=SGLAU_24410 PE=4 SV=1 [Streptomyces glaucescens]